MKKTWAKELEKEGYTSHFLFNLLILGIIYKTLGWEWFWVIAIADISRDLGMVVKKLYKK